MICLRQRLLGFQVAAPRSAAACSKPWSSPRRSDLICPIRPTNQCCKNWKFFLFCTSMSLSILNGFFFIFCLVYWRRKFHVSISWSPWSALMLVCLVLWGSFWRLNDLSWYSWYAGLQNFAVPVLFRMMGTRHPSVQLPVCTKVCVLGSEEVFCHVCTSWFEYSFETYVWVFCSFLCVPFVKRRQSYGICNV